MTSQERVLEFREGMGVRLGEIPETFLLVGVAKLIDEAVAAERERWVVGLSAAADQQEDAADGPESGCEDSDTYQHAADMLRVTRDKLREGT